MPKRIQRQRTKGWKMPEGAVYVGRPGKWGNPYDVETFGLQFCLALYADTTRGVWSALTDEPSVYLAHRDWLKRIDGHPIERAVSELRGKDLACWCPLDKPCHADVLLEIANA